MSLSVQNIEVMEVHIGPLSGGCQSLLLFFSCRVYTLHFPNYGHADRVSMKRAFLQDNYYDRKTDTYKPRIGEIERREGKRVVTEMSGRTLLKLRELQAELGTTTDAEMVRQCVNGYHRAVFGDGRG